MASNGQKLETPRTVNVPALISAFATGAAIVIVRGSGVAATGVFVGATVGATVGASVAATVGTLVGGAGAGVALGTAVGTLVGTAGAGVAVGTDVGTFVALGTDVGTLVALAAIVGTLVFGGAVVGTSVCEGATVAGSRVAVNNAPVGNGGMAVAVATTAAVERPVVTVAFVAAGEPQLANANMTKLVIAMRRIMIYSLLPIA